MTTYRVGDRGTVEGTVGGLSTDNQLYLVPNIGVGFYVPAVAFTRTERALPEEPPVGTVIRTVSHGALWVNKGDGSLRPWRTLRPGPTRIDACANWPELLKMDGPVTILVPGETVGIDQ